MTEEQNQQAEPAAQEQAPAIIEKKIPVKPPVAVSANADGSLTGATLEERYRVADAWFRSKMVPATYENAVQVLGAMELSIQLGIPPLVGLNKIAVINGNPSIWGEMPLALVRKSGQLELIKEKIFDSTGAEIGVANPLAEPFMAVCEVVRKDGSTTTTFFTMDDAKRAGLLGRKNVWATYPRRMIQMRARSQALKDVFPDILMGCSIAEYDHNVIPNDTAMRTVNRVGEDKRDAADEVANKLKA